LKIRGAIFERFFLDKSRVCWSLNFTEREREGEAFKNP